MCGMQLKGASLPLLLRSELHFAQRIAITDSKKEKENVKLAKLPNVPALNNQILLQHPE